MGLKKKKEERKNKRKDGLGLEEGKRGKKEKKEEKNLGLGLKVGLVLDFVLGFWEWVLF